MTAKLIKKDFLGEYRFMRLLQEVLSVLIQHIEWKGTV